MFNELKTKDDAWMQSIHERIDRLSAMIDGIFGDGAVPPKEDVYLCDSEVACMLKVSRRTLGEYRSNGTLPYYVLGGNVLLMPILTGFKPGKLSRRSFTR